MKKGGLAGVGHILTLLTIFPDLLTTVTVCPSGILNGFPAEVAPGRTQLRDIRRQNQKVAGKLSWNQSRGSWASTGAGESH